MATGWRDTKSLVMLTGWDATELQSFQLQDGTTFAQIVAEMNAALAALNAELYSDPLWSSLCSYTDQPNVEYRVGASNGYEDHTEYGSPDPKRAATEGHMLPLKKYDRAVGWTVDYLEDARLEQVQADIADAIADSRTKFRVACLSRVLDRDDDSGTAKGLGASGYSPGFATTAGSTSVDFIPPTYGGTSFANTHEHYIGITGDAWTLAAFQDMKAELREHGHEPPYEFITGPSDEAGIRALSDFIPAPSVAGVQYASTVSLAPGLSMLSDMNGNYYIGVIEDIRVKIVRGMPFYWGFCWKSYGANSQRNPLRVRLHKGVLRPQVIARPDPTVGGSNPLAYLMTQMQFGVGVSDRTNGTPRYNHSATWADGTAT